MTSLNNYQKNNTAAYYKDLKPDLLHEMTICQCLSSKDSPYIKLLTKEESYGELIGNLIKSKIATPKIVVEIGGGYGTLMNGLLKVIKPDKIFMVDLSSHLLERQRGTLNNFKNIEFINSDIFDFLENFDKKIDLFICNEVIGDLETTIEVSKSDFEKDFDLDTSYLPDTFNLNTGALKLVKSINGKVKFGFISEHSSTFELPSKYKDIINDDRKNLSPREIKLFGHSEFTINFKMLVEYLEQNNFYTTKKHFFDLLPLRDDQLIRFVLASHSNQTDFHEIINEFYNHIFEYESILIQEKGN